METKETLLSPRIPLLFPLLCPLSGRPMKWLRRPRMLPLVLPAKSDPEWMLRMPTAWLVRAARHPQAPQVRWRQRWSRRRLPRTTLSINASPRYFVSDRPTNVTRVEQSTRSFLERSSRRNKRRKQKVSNKHHRPRTSFGTYCTTMAMKRTLESNKFQRHDNFTSTISSLIGNLGPNVKMTVTMTTTIKRRMKAMIKRKKNLFPVRANESPRKRRQRQQKGGNQAAAAVDQEKRHGRYGRAFPTIHWKVAGQKAGQRRSFFADRVLHRAIRIAIGFLPNNNTNFDQ
mmetsp:Transcript_26483/g.49437  ORF Transcript_26483/g.49437 Transcript_26483/m.49437 type:complete len:286 (+) Transcript_26483:133-990(+)